MKKPEKCFNCGSKDYEIRITAVKANVYRGGKIKFVEQKVFRVAERTFICDDCNAEVNF